MKKLLIEQAKLIPGLNPAAQPAGTVTGPVIDRQGFLSAIVNLTVGAAAGAPTAQGVSLKLQHGDAANGTDMVDVTGAATPSLTADNTNASFNVDMTGLKRYIRVVATVTFTDGTTPTIPVAATLALGDADKHPVA